jgi:hypothetical protein
MAKSSSEKVTALQMVQTDSRDGHVILEMKDSEGAPYELKLNTMDVASLVGSLRACTEEAIAHPSASNVGMPGMKRVQYVETPETAYFRVFLSDHLFHEYPVPLNTTLGAELKEFGDRVEARNAAKATHPLSGSPDRKN